jgi:hypothetical protein
MWGLVMVGPLVNVCTIEVGKRDLSPLTPGTADCSAASSPTASTVYTDQIQPN